MADAKQARRHRESGLDKGGDLQQHGDRSGDGPLPERICHGRAIRHLVRRNQQTISRQDERDGAVFSIIPRDEGFYNLFEQAAQVIIETAQKYSELSRHYDRREQLIAEIRQCEQKADEVVHTALAKLDTTFITPFDREDIQTLLKRMDDVVDEIDAAAKRMTLYRITEPTIWLVKQTDVLVKASHLIGEAVKRLRDVRKQTGLHDKLVEIHQLENVGDDNNHAAVAELFTTATDAMYVMKWREIYDRTEKAIDRCEDIADTIEGIVLKNA